MNKHKILIFIFVINYIAMVDDDLYKKFWKYIMDAKYIVAFTGAGISVESGIPAFRGENGLWTRYDPEEYASIEAFMKSPNKIWEMMLSLKDTYIKAEPNYAHKVLALLEEKEVVKTVITQNVDGLHQRAGSKNVIELHGSLNRVKCLVCGYTMDINIFNLEELPRCPFDGAVLKPDVVFFGEPLPRDQWIKAMRETYQADVFLMIGTSGVVYPAAMLPQIAQENGSIIIEVNPSRTSLSSLSHISIREKAGVFFKKIFEIYFA